MDIISKIDGKWLQDVSSIHKIEPEVSTFKITYANPKSNYTTVSHIELPSDVMLKETAAALRYIGAIDASVAPQSAWLPDASKGWTWKVKSAGSICGVTVEIGDMIICNTHTTKTNSSTCFDFVQSNLDPTTFSQKGHTHTVNSGTITTSNNGGFTPSGTVQTSVSGKSTTVQGTNTPKGTVTFSYNVNSTQHSHTFTGTTATISLTYVKPNNCDSASATIAGTIDSHTYKPAGSVSVTCTSTSTSGTTSGSISQTSHSHTFTGTAKNISLTYQKAPANTNNATASVSGSINSHSYTPTGTCSAPTITVSTPTSTCNYATGAINGYSYTDTATNDKAITTTSYNSTTEELSFTKDYLHFKKLTGITLATSSFTYINSVSATASTVTFYGDSSTMAHTYNLSAQHNHAITTTSATTSASYTPAGTLSSVAPTISHTLGATYMKVTNVTASFSGTTATLSHSYSLNAAHTHTLTTTSGTTSVNYQPAGSLSNSSSNVSGNGSATFKGTADTYSAAGTPLIESATSTFTGDAVAGHTHTLSFSTTSGTSSK
ncbi:MAG: hypothetical protein [Wendovervirus sonii]|uniref:Tail fiber protein n=1 Tax=phage Lak_Megaphage_Sonny TaxID=3109229 RepID=A0ABZ0Z664_9CAUD|nr:MAG: hypothetical protein [phage Lak_Megaphage_Sonny]